MSQKLNLSIVAKTINLVTDLLLIIISLLFTPFHKHYHSGQDKQKLQYHKTYPMKLYRNIILNRIWYYIFLGYVTLKMYFNWDVSFENVPFDPSSFSVFAKY